MLDRGQSPPAEDLVQNTAAIKEVAALSNWNLPDPRQLQIMRVTVRGNGPFQLAVVEVLIVVIVSSAITDIADHLAKRVRHDEAQPTLRGPLPQLDLKSVISRHANVVTSESDTAVLRIRTQCLIHLTLKARIWPGDLGMVVDIGQQRVSQTQISRRCHVEQAR